MEVLYSLAMSAEIKIADDGVAEVGMMHARSNLTTLVRDVRYGGRVGAFTERGRRQVILVTPEFYERAKAALGDTDQS